jgi:hypothetical protein
MDEQRDFGIAVTDAKRLDDCWHELTEALAARPPGDGDEAHHFQRTQASPGNEEWVHHANSRNLAEILLRDAILQRKLPFWLRLREEEALVDSNAIKNVTHKFFTTGRYLTYDRPESYLERRPLWIKNMDWAQFYSGVMASRYGEQAEAALQSKLSNVEGDLPSDDVILAKMHELIGEGRRRDEAAKHIRTVPGFDQVQNEHARRVVRGTLKRGRPRRAPEKAAEKPAQESAYAFIAALFHYRDVASIH